MPGSSPTFPKMIGEDISCVGGLGISRRCFALVQIHSGSLAQVKVWITVCWTAPDAFLQRSALPFDCQPKMAAEIQRSLPFSSQRACFVLCWFLPPFAFAGAGVTSKTPQLLSHVGCLRGIPTDSMASGVDFLSR